MELEAASKSVTPFLKWAGGKRWLVDKHSYLFDVKYKRYVEPFLGSGAVFFHTHPKSSILSDTNKELIDTYSAIKNDWHSVVKLLIIHQRKHSRDYYYYMRSLNPRNPAPKAARFIYLNRTCWNGLYRVNMNGVYNVPIGTKNKVILDADDFGSVAQALSSSKLVTCDFEDTLKICGKDDFVFIDPPYTVKHNYNGFIKYNQGLFTWEDQIRLRNCIGKAADRGSKIIVTNAYHKSILSLYKGFTHIKMQRASVISGLSVGRGIFDEVLIPINI